MMKICVLIPVKDNICGLNNTLNSIFLDTKFPAMIFICDDGSAEQIVLENRIGAHQITLIKNNENVGVSASLNRLLDLAISQEYEIAFRMDAGDIWIAGRFKRQIDYMLKFEDVVVLGGGAIIESEEGKCIGNFIPPISSSELCIRFRAGYPIYHPTVALRLNYFAITGLRFVTHYEAAEDYDLFYRIYKMNPSYVANVSEILIKYVRESSSVGVNRSRRQAYSALLIRLKYFSPNNIWSWLGVFDPRLWGRILFPKCWNYVSLYLRSFRRIRG